MRPTAGAASRHEEGRKPPQTQTRDPTICVCDGFFPLVARVAGRSRELFSARPLFLGFSCARSVTSVPVAALHAHEKRGREHRHHELLIYGEERKLTPAESEQVYAGHRAYGEAMTKVGVMRSGAS